MIDSMKELKALEELAEDLRLLFQNEHLLIAEGWYSDLEFLYAVFDTIKEGIKKMQEE